MCSHSGESGRLSGARRSKICERCSKKRSMSGVKRFAPNTRSVRFNMSERLSSEGLKSASDVTKQLITLSTALLGLTVTFPVNLAIDSHVGTSTKFSLVLFGLAIAAGVATLQAITGTLDAMDRKQNGLSTNPIQDEAISMLA